MIALTGIIFMESEGPHAMTTTTAIIGLIGSALLILGGIVGAYTKRWVTLLPGTILIMITLALTHSPSLWAIVVAAIILLLYCWTTRKDDRNVELSHLTDDFDRCFGVDESSSHVV